MSNNEMKLTKPALARTAAGFAAYLGVRRTVERYRESEASRIHAGRALAMSQA